MLQVGKFFASSCVDTICLIKQLSLLSFCLYQLINIEFLLVDCFCKLGLQTLCDLSKCLGLSAFRIKRYLKFPDFLLGNYAILNLFGNLQVFAVEIM
jgi:hypothetical protein